jgi:hypothetical protein
VLSQVLLRAVTPPFHGDSKPARGPSQAVFRHQAFGATGRKGFPNRFWPVTQRPERRTEEGNGYDNGDDNLPRLSFAEEDAGAPVDWHVDRFRKPDGAGVYGALAGYGKRLCDVCSPFPRKASHHAPYLIRGLHDWIVPAPSARG